MTARTPLRRLHAVVLCAAIASGTGALRAQQPGASPKAGVVGTGALTVFVEDMDRSLAFYQQAFGMEVPPLPESGARPFNRSNPRLFAMFDIDGARERHQSAKAPGVRTQLEAMEVRDVPFKTVPLRPQDPGNLTLVLLVRDVDATLAQATKAGAVVVTTGGSPVTFADGTRAVLLKDPDGRFIEVRQPAQMPAGATGTGNIADLRIAIAVADMTKTLQVYRDALGFTVDAETPFTKDAKMRALTGLADAETRQSRVQVTGSPLVVEFVEYKGVPRIPLAMKIQDRGAARVQVRAQQIDEVVSRMKQAGLTVVSQGGGPVPIPPNFRGALVADPNNFFLTFIEPCDNCATFGPSPGPGPARSDSPVH